MTGLGVAERDVRTRPRVLAPAVGVAVLGVLIVVRALTDGATWSAPDALRDGITLASSVLIESLPYVLLGILLAVVVRVWVPEWWIMRLLPRQPILRRAVLSCVGVLLPVCECGNMPLARGLMERGLTVPEASTFLLAAPILNPITIVTTFQAFGWSHGILLARVIGGFVIANAIGALLARHPDPWRLVTPGFVAACERHEHEHGTRMQRSARGFFEETAEIMPALVIGSVVAAVVQVGVTRQAIVTLGQNPVWSVVALMLLAVVVALCSTVDAFFVLAFGSTFLPGAIVAFLVLGPMVDVRMLALMRTTYRARAVILIAVLCALGALLLGLAVNLA